METLFHVCCVPVLELKPKMVKFCHQIQISKTQNANLQNSFKNLTTNKIVRKNGCEMPKIPLLEGMLKEETRRGEC